MTPGGQTQVGDYARAGSSPGRKDDGAIFTLPGGCHRPKNAPFEGQSHLDGPWCGVVGG